MLNEINQTPKHNVCGWVYKNTTRHHNPGDVCNKKIDLTKELCSEHTRISQRPVIRKSNQTNSIPLKSTFILPTRVELLT